MVNYEGWRDNFIKTNTIPKEPKKTRWDNAELIKENEARSIPVPLLVLKEFNKFFDENYRKDWGIVDEDGNVFYENL